MMVHLVLEQILGHLIHVRVHNIRATWMDIGNELYIQIIRLRVKIFFVPTYAGIIHKLCELLIKA